MKLNYNTLGIDIGSTTVKIAILNTNGEIIFSDYQSPVAALDDSMIALQPYRNHSRSLNIR